MWNIAKAMMEGKFISTECFCWKRRKKSNQYPQFPPQETKEKQNNHKEKRK